MKTLSILCLVAFVSAQDDGYGRAPAPATNYGGSTGGRYNAASGGQSSMSSGGSVMSSSNSQSQSGGMKKQYRHKAGGSATGGSRTSGSYTAQTGSRTNSQSAYGATSNTAFQAQVADVQTMTGAEAANAAIMAAVANGANKNNFGIKTNAQYSISTSKNSQNPVVWDALDLLRGKVALDMVEILQIMYSAVGGTDYPAFNEIPDTSFSCESVKQAGYYADTQAQCQVIRRCDINGVMWSYLCPNMTLFNQITLVCDYFFNIDCSKAQQFYDYSNPRLYTEFNLLDDGEYAGAAKAAQNNNAGGGTYSGYGPVAPAPRPVAPRPSKFRPAPRPVAPRPAGGNNYGPAAPVAPPAPRPSAY